MSKSNKLPGLSDEQKMWMVDCHASGLPIDEMAVNIREVFPDYAPDIPEEVFAKQFRFRAKQILNHPNSSAHHYLRYKRVGELPIALAANPMAHPHVRLMYYQRLWNEAQADEKATIREKLAILAAFRKDEEVMNAITDHIPTLSKPGSGNVTADPSQVGPDTLGGEPNADSEQTQ